MVTRFIKRSPFIILPILFLIVILPFLFASIADAHPDLRPLNQEATRPPRATNTPEPEPTRPPRPTDTRPAPTNPPHSASQPTSTIPVITIASPTPTNFPFVVPSPTPIVDPYDHQFPLTMKSPTPTAPSFAGPAIPDLEITAVEVTQGLQSIYNDMPLAAKRWTYVRVYVKTDGSAYANVKGALLGTRAGQNLGIIYAANQPITAKGDGGERTDVDDSLYFALPNDWIESGHLKIKAFVYSVVPSAPHQHEPNASNNYMDVLVEFQPAEPIRISFIPIHLHADYNGALPEKLYTLGEPDAWSIIYDMLRHIPAPTVQVYSPPVEVVYCYTSIYDIDASWYEIMFNLVDEQAFAEHGSCNFDFSIKGGMQYATVMMAMIDTYTDDPVEDLLYYGMVHPDFDGEMTFFKENGDTLNFTGIALNGQAYGIMKSEIWNNTPWYMPGGLTLAHEVGHRLGLGHANCAGDEEAGGGLDDDFPWTFPDCSIANVNEEGFYGFDVMYLIMPGTDDPTVISNDPGASPPNQGFPMMGYQSPKWIDAFHYCKLLLSLGVDCEPFGPPLVVGRPEHNLHLSIRRPPGAHENDLQTTQTDTAAGFLIVTGIVDFTTQSAALLDIAHLDEEPSDLEDPHSLDHEETNFEVALLDSSGSVIASRPIIDTTVNHEPPAYLSFFVGLPYPETTERITVRFGGDVVAERRVSANTPVVNLLKPDGGEIFEGPFDIVWEASDADSDDLAYTVQYSPDGGGTWSVLAVNLSEPFHRLRSLNTLQGSEQGMIRVLANDGVNVGSDTSDGTFSVPNTPPLPAIASPAHTKIFPSGARIDFMGSGTDREDGLLPDQALSWTSDRDGELGTGTTLSRRDLSPGRHVITLTATDSGGISTGASIAIAIDGEQSVDIPSQEEMDQLEEYLSIGFQESPRTEQADTDPTRTESSNPPRFVFILIASAALLGMSLFIPLLRRVFRRE